ncbi:MAG TPA: DUF1890 domain-containing protein [Methanotrichaceae archaeon]|nr:DUF1890 domain-containing protein [Methanotrichaceae archaeon]
MAEDAPKRVLLMMGCPEVPVQMSIVLYLSNKLSKEGMEVTVAGTDAALKLLKVSDPEGHYVRNTVDVDQLISDIVEKKTDFDICFAFMHSDAGVVYAATMSAISKARMYAVVFGKNAESLADTVEFDAQKIVAKATHNPNPLKNKLDKVVL